MTQSARVRRSPRPLALDVAEDPVQHGSESKIVEKANDLERLQRYEKPRLVQLLVPGSESSAHQGAEEDKQHTGRHRDEQRLLAQPAYQGTPRVRPEIKR